MSFTDKYLPVAKQRYFTFFATGATAGGAGYKMDEQFNPSFAFMLDKIRLHLSTLLLSTNSFTVLISHHLGGAYNEVLISLSASCVLDYVYQADPDRYFHLGDTFSCAMEMGAENTYGLEISGWAVTVPSRA